MTSSKKISDLLEKTKHYDADERYMATRDLIAELKTSATIESSLQVPIRNAILAQLDDKAPDVSTIAVKCLSQLVTQFANDHITYIIDKLGQMIVDKSKADSREMVADGLKSVLATLSGDVGKSMMGGLTKSLVIGLSGKPDAKEITLEMVCLDVLKDVMERYSTDIPSEHTNIMNALTRLLEHPAEPVRKRAGVTLGPLVTVLNDEAFSQLIQLIIKKIETAHSKEAYIQTIGVISRTAGVRIGQALDKIVPQLQKFLKADEAKGDDEAQLDLWENCLQALESIIRRCPNKVTPFVRNIVNNAIAFLSYDPNYTYEEEGAEADAGDFKDDFGGGGDDWGSGGGGGGDWGSGAADEGTTSADSSWKVRRAACGVLQAFIRVRSDILKDYYKDLSDILIARFKERDSSVKEEILFAMRDLLHETVVSEKAVASENKESEGMLEVPVFVRTRSSYETLDLKVKDIVGGCDKQFPKGDARTQKAIFGVLAELVLVRRGDLDIEKITPHVISGIETKAADVNADALKVLHLILEFHNFKQLQPFIAKFTAATTKLVASGSTNVVPEALRVLGSIGKKAAGQSGTESLAKDLYKATMTQLVQKDVTQKIKLTSISTMAIVLASFGLSGEMKNVVPVFIERLGNEVTRQPVLRALARIANSEAKVDLSLFASNSAIIKDMTSFFRKMPQALRHETVIAFEALIRTHTSSFKAQDIQVVISEAAALIGDEDLQGASLTLTLVSTALAAAGPTAGPVAAKDILPRALALVKSPLLQGAALGSLIRFFQTAVNAEKEKAFTYAALLQALIASVDGSLHKSSFSSVAQAIAGITIKVGGGQVRDTVTKFVGDVKSSSPPHVQNLALLVVGEIGKGSDLSDFKGIENVAFSAMDSKDDGVRAAGSFALGNISVGSLNKFLPTLLELVKSKHTYQYSLYASIKEALVTLTKDKARAKTFQPYVDQVVPILTQSAEAKDEGVRAMVAQCLGLLTIVDTAKVLAVLGKLLGAQAPVARAVSIIGLRFALSPLVDYSLIASQIETFLALLGDKDLVVRREALLTLNAVLRANFEVIRVDTLKQKVLPALYSETKVKPELVTERDYGAFKEVIDAGLPLRKAAFQCLSTMLDVCSHRLNMQEYISFMQQGLVDLPDVQVSTYQTFAYIATYHGSSLLEILNSLPELLMKHIMAHLKAIKAKEPDQQSLDCLRAFLRALLAFNKIPGHEQSQKYTHFFKQILATPQLAALMKEGDN